MSLGHDLLEVRLVRERLEVPNWRLCACLEAPEGQVEVRGCQGAVQYILLTDGRHVRVALSELLVVGDQFLLHLRIRELNADARLRSVA